jgi:hypothetical protein
VKLPSSDEIERQDAERFAAMTRQTGDGKVKQVTAKRQSNQFVWILAGITSIFAIGCIVAVVVIIGKTGQSTTVEKQVFPDGGALTPVKSAAQQDTEIDDDELIKTGVSIALEDLKLAEYKVTNFKRIWSNPKKNQFIIRLDMEGSVNEVLKVNKNYCLAFFLDGAQWRWTRRSCLYVIGSDPGDKFISHIKHANGFF